jgi:hypothetical protein
MSPRATRSDLRLPVKRNGGPPLRPFWRVLLRASLTRRRPAASTQPEEQGAFEAWHRDLIQRGDLPYVEVRWSPSP